MCFVISPRHLAARCVTTHSAVPSAAFLAWRDSNRLVRTPICVPVAATRCRTAEPKSTSPFCSPTFAVQRRSASGPRPADFATLLNRFYAAATQALIRRDAVIDKLIGDEVMAFFVRGISGPDYRHQAVRAGLELLSAVGYGMDSGPWLDVGAAVNAGPAYVGNVGGAVVDFTALGDTVNAAARMQQAAAGGELLVAAGVADDLVAHGSRRQLALRGRDRPIEAFVLTT